MKGENKSKRMEQKIVSVDKNSVGEELGLEPGDVLLSIDDTPIEDVLDYYFLTDDGSFTLQVRTRQGDEAECEVELSEGETLGLHFEEEFMGKYRHCSNHCAFCFIDQLPKGLRRTMYFKDDDARLSFLNGNYITMTNMSDSDFNKIIRYHLSPINVSVHTTNPDLRVRMLKNPKAARIMEELSALCEAGITLNAQIVLCKGLNDGDELIRSIRDLSRFMPHLESLSVVPVGLTKFREGLTPLEPFTKEDALRVIDAVEPLQKEFYREYGLHFVHLSDEFYYLADRPLPPAGAYDGYLQIENGVGMMRSFVDDFESSLAAVDIKPDAVSKPRTVSFVTAPCAYHFIEPLLPGLEKKVPGLTVQPLCLQNNFFGHNITVTGLLTGRDILAQIRAWLEAVPGRTLGDRLLLPQNMLRLAADLPNFAEGIAASAVAPDEMVFLDDFTLRELKEALGVQIEVSGACDFVASFIH